ncbi:3-hydroxyacyl-CoA dehydrogenase NAD-binding domain-containing protein [Bradyrhizobium yuanmingense]|uniref:3-hydroxyacyl-CoA dehydrogenase NAD-binding domain-containing protein n=1 Tax=Bradyrhizobium yuanmingense TaxID=108015 RepID=UPI0023B8D5EB|nr:3-hydroxyacyl-CoA dehydrogenase NAD-binding domain-containing protein [Bradyrhizobium yuanmingense]MDF0498991.1 3-hydroxyacyl-CoA dehydrogenase NAD-binding domain-containing protein [Bradyrhizobium yuanmingense]
MSERLPRAVGLLGGGVIGGGWAARFILNGVDVRLYGPSSAAVERVQKKLAKARRAYRRLTQVPLPAEGTLTVVNSVADAVRGVDLVQENAPERLEIKQPLLASACQAAAPETLICSSTSNIIPSLLQAEMPRPERLLVAHPFQPVYLVPLVELCAGQRTAPEMLPRAAEIYRAVGMHPLVVRKEIDGFIANRLQTAAWREALWLVHDEVATVQEIDDAVRYSFGLRRSVLGPIMTYFVGSGEASIRAFLKKWGSGNNASKLTEVPEYTDSFLDKLTEQSDAMVSAENMTISEYTQMLDDGLVRVLQGLRSERWGAGETLARWEQSLRKRVPPVH